MPWYSCCNMLCVIYKTNVMNTNVDLNVYESPVMEIMEIQMEQAVLSASLTGEGTNNDELM